MVLWFPGCRRFRCDPESRLGSNNRSRDSSGPWFMPLPDLLDENRFDAGFLSEIGTIRGSHGQLDLSKRIASLSELGVLLLQQRFIANLARISVKLATLDTASAAMLIEAELLADWQETLAKHRVRTGVDLDLALADETRAFTTISPPVAPTHSARSAQTTRLARPCVELCAPRFSGVQPTCSDL